MFLIMLTIFTLLPFAMLFDIETKSKNPSKLKFRVGLVYSFFEMVFMFIYNIICYDYSSYNITSYFINYDNGFISRGLIGSVFKLIFGYTPSFLPILLIIQSVFYILCYLIQAYLFFKICKKTQENPKYSLLENFFFIWNISLCTPAFFLLTSKMDYTLMSFSTEYLRIDIFFYFLGLLSIVVLLKEKRSAFDYILLIIFSALNILIHQGTFFIYIPTIAFLFLYDAFYVEKTKLAKVFLVIFVLVIGILFLLCQFNSNVEYEDILRYVIKATERCDIAFSRSNYIMLTMEYKYSVIEHHNLFYGLVLTLVYFSEGISMLLLYYSTLLILAINIIKNFRIQINKKLFILHIIYLILAKLALYGLTVDWFRWVSFDVQCIGFALIYFTMKERLELRTIEKEEK